MGFLNSIWDFLKNLIKSIIDFIKKILPYVLLAIAIWLALGFPFIIPFLGYVIPAGVASALLVAGASFLIAPDETAAIVSHVATSIGGAVGSIVAAGVGVVTTGIGAFFSSPVGLLTLGVGLWFLLGRDRDKKEEKDNVVGDYSTTARLSESTSGGTTQLGYKENFA